MNTWKMFPFGHNQTVCCLLSILIHTHQLFLPFYEPEVLGNDALDNRFHTVTATDDKEISRSEAYEG